MSAENSDYLSPNARYGVILQKKDETTIGRQNHRQKQPAV
jgi:hypothetical protein